MVLDWGQTWRDESVEATEKQQKIELAKTLLAEQHFVAACIGGFVAMILSATAYGIAKSLAEGYYYSILAAGIGLCVGFTMQFLGRGIGARFALLAGVYALLGCVAGNVFAAAMDIARATAVSPFQVMFDAGLPRVLRWISSDLPIADIMFWLIGIGGAVYFARRPLTYEQAFALHTFRMQG